MTEDYERRAFTLTEIRANAEGEPPEINGYAAVYNALSEEMWGFREIIEPGFFENVLNDDVRALWNHDTNLPIGRTRNHTLALSDDDKGLGVRILPPDTQAGRDALVSIRRGDVDQMSFAFKVKVGGDDFRKDADGNVTRVLKRGGCEGLFDVSPVTFPAYPQTSVSVRSRFESFTAASATAAAGANEETRKPTRLANLKLKLRLLRLR